MTKSQTQNVVLILCPMFLALTVRHYSKMNSKYKNCRKEILSSFNPKNIIDKSEKSYSPSGNFYLIISYYNTGENTWAYSQGTIKNSKNDKIVADIKRNFSHFWYSWIEHTNGNEYLLCGEDYQGQTVVNLTKRTVKNYFPEAGFDGHGFCWANAIPSKNSEILAVEGCYWACPYDIVFFDFTNPDELPFKELKRIKDVGEVQGWNENNDFILDKEVEIRKSDGKPYNKLTNEEQEILDNDSKLIDYKIVMLKVNLEEIKNNI